MTPAARLRAFFITCGLGAVVAGGVTFWRWDPVHFGMLERLERAGLDQRFRLRTAPPPPDDTVLFAYDDRTLSERPWLFERRAGVAAVIHALHNAGAKVIGLDLLFTEPEQVLPPALMSRVEARRAVESDPEGRQLLDDIVAEAGGDQALIDAMAAAHHVVLGFHAGRRGDPPGREIGRGKFGQVLPGPRMPPLAERVLAPLTAFTKASARLGVVSVFQDEGGALRTVPLGLQLGESVVASFPVQLAAHALGVSRSAMAWNGEDGSLLLGDRRVASESGTLWLDWRDTPPPTFSVVDLVDGNVPAKRWTEKIAIVGFTHLAQDRVNAPFGLRPGIEVHATALRQILHGDRIIRVAPWVDAALAWLLATSVAAVFAFPARAAVRAVGVGTLLVGALVASQVAFVAGGQWVSWIGLVMAWLVATVAGLGLGWVHEGRQGRELRRLFANYLSPALVEELAANPARASLGGERRELSVLFTDIVGFTQFSERLAPTELSAFLREYLGPMTRVVLDHAGYVDKYIGDAIMAVYGAPVIEARHAEKACQTAIALHAALVPLRPVAQRYGIDLAIGVGVNSGEMVVGNLGSAERFDYTVLGDSVNFASRIEGLTRHYGVFCLIGPRTRALAGSGFTTRNVAAVRVKGKAETIEIFELCAGPNGTIVAYDEIETFDAGRRAWAVGDFAEAERQFEAFLAKNPHDPVSRLYLDALAGHRGVVPSVWDGVFEHREK